MKQKLSAGLNAIVHDGAHSLLRRLPVGFWKAAAPKSAIGVCYHLVSDSPPPHLKHYRASTVAEFSSDLDYLHRKFSFQNYTQLASRRSNQAARRDNAVMLTFDDGFSECASVVAPLLARRNIDCVFFIITDLIDNNKLFHESLAALCIDAILAGPPIEALAAVRDLGLATMLQPPIASAAPGAVRPPLDMAGLRANAAPELLPLLQGLLTLGPAQESSLRALAGRLGVDADAYLRAARPYLTAAEIRALHGQGFTIGAHSCSHRRLQSLPPDEAAHEIVNSCRIIADLTGQPSVPFAFPYNGYGLDRRWLNDLRRRHSCIGLFFDTDGLREDEDFVVQRVFGERLGYDASLDGILRRSWSKRSAWARRG